MRNDVMKTLLMGALKQSGSYNPKETLPYIEEALQPEEVRYLTGLLEWIRKDTNNRSVGPGNWDKRIAQYERSLKKPAPSKKKPRAIKTEQDLDAHIDALPEKEVRQIVKQIAGLFYVEDDNERTLNIDKELSGADFIADVSQILTSRGIKPTSR